MNFFNFVVVHETDTFGGGRVVYTTPKNNDGLVAFTKLTYALHEKFQREGLVDNDIKKDFKPHATLMKLRRKTIIRHKGGEKKEVIRRIPSEIYEHFKGKASYYLTIPFKLVISVYLSI